MFVIINSMEMVYNLLLFWLGAIFGSFAGAVAWRIKKKKDFVRGRSECEHCHHVLAPLDLIPIFSWLFLRGRCRYCKKPIGASTLLVELGLGLAFMLSYIAWPLGFDGVLSGTLFGLWLVALVMFAVLFLYDLRWTLLPDKVVFPLIAVSLLFFVGSMVLSGVSPTTAVLEFCLAIAPIAGIYGVLYFASGGKWVGFGDVKLGIALGLLLGWQGALLTLVLANFIGLLFVLPGLVSRQLGKSSRVPFGPFLMLAACISFLYGSYLIDAYMKLLLV
ncbi:MAG TPA: prepilin peptidase [Candidatus Saccharibacteria bacterium]|nr:prepilin peptidase [Candidatus Saccharibacteria bacterium]